MQKAQLETSTHIPIFGTLEEEGLLYIKLAGNLAPVHNTMSYMHYAYIIRCAFIRKWNFLIIIYTGVMMLPNIQFVNES